MNKINLFIFSLLFLAVLSSCSFDSKNKEIKQNQEGSDFPANYPGSNKKDKKTDEQNFEFQLLNDNVGRYFSEENESSIFIITDSSGNIQYDTAMHKFLEIEGAGCYGDKDERFTFLETPVKFSIYDDLRCISSINEFNVFIITNNQIGIKEFLLVTDSRGFLKSFIEIKHSITTKYCKARRNYSINENQKEFSIEFRDYVSRTEPDFENEISGILFVNGIGEIMVEYNGNA